MRIRVSGWIVDGWVGGSSAFERSLQEWPAIHSVIISASLSLEMSPVWQSFSFAYFFTVLFPCINVAVSYSTVGLLGSASIGYICCCTLCPTQADTFIKTHIALSRLTSLSCFSSCCCCCRCCCCCCCCCCLCCCLCCCFCCCCCHRLIRASGSSSSP